MFLANKDSLDYRTTGIYGVVVVDKESLLAYVQPTFFILDEKLKMKYVNA